MSERKAPGDVAVEMAGLAVETAVEVHEVRLDYSVESLGAVDAIVRACGAAGMRLETHPGTAWMFGCYVGEVIRRQGGGRWVAAEDVPGGLMGESGLIYLQSGAREEERFCNPIEKVAKGLADPEGGHDLRAFGAMSLASAETLAAMMAAQEEEEEERGRPKRRGWWARLFGGG